MTVRACLPCAQGSAVVMHQGHGLAWYTQVRSAALRLFALRVPPVPVARARRGGGARNPYAQAYLSPPFARGGGVPEATKNVCVPQIGLKFRTP